jgi:hypothetical protein
MAHSPVREHARMIAPFRNRWIRIQGVTLVMLVMSQVDRANIALAFPAMRAELGLCRSRWAVSPLSGAPNAPS